MTLTPDFDVTAAGERSRRSDGFARPSSIRSRWNRSFALVLVVLVVGGLLGLGANHRVVNDYRSRAERLETEASRLAALRANLATHTRVAHGLMERPDPVDEGQATDRAASIGVSFEQAMDESSDAETKRLYENAQAQWQEALAVIAGHDRSRSVEATVEAHASLAEHTDATVALLDEAGEAGRAEARAGLERAQDAQRISTAASLVIFATVLVLVARMGRRLSVDVLRPVSRLRASAERLTAGDLDHRVDLGRRAIGDGDELADLAVSFNAMADAIGTSHRLLTRQANHDSLTGLANRAAFHARLDAALAHPQRRDGTQAVLFVDLDDFKDVNDTLGHSAGDELLTVIAHRLADLVRPGDLAARLGGDEFAVLIDGVADPAAALAVAERAVAALSVPVRLVDGSVVHVSASVGLAMRHDDSDPESLMQEADVAMYLAKGHGKNRVERYDPVLHAADTDHQALKTDIVEAEQRGELVLDYQPIVELATGYVAGSEALVRWQHPTRGLLPPSAFIPLAEHTGAIIDIGTWVLDTALGQLRRWQDTHDRPDLVVSVNVSVHQLNTTGFAEHVEQLLRHARVDPARLVLEITESVLAETAGPAATTLAALRRLGVRVALDDFGTGYSSIGYLHQLPVDVLKIDRSFVSGDPGQRGDVLLDAIVGLAQRLGLDVIPEGIEESDQLARLRDLGCRNGQGFLLSRPIPPAAIDQLLADPAPLLHGEPADADPEHPAPVHVG